MNAINSDGIIVRPAHTRKTPAWGLMEPSSRMSCSSHIVGGGVQVESTRVQVESTVIIFSIKV